MSCRLSKEALATISGSKIDGEGNVFVSPGARLSIHGETVGVKDYKYSLSLPAGTYKLISSVPEGYSVAYSVCDNCSDHPGSSYTAGESVTVNVSPGAFADVNWRYIKKPVIASSYDVTGDGIVTYDDVKALRFAAAGLTECPTQSCDVNSDGVVDILDMAAVRNYLARKFDFNKDGVFTRDDVSLIRQAAAGIVECDVATCDTNNDSQVDILDVTIVRTFSYYVYGF